MFYEVQRLVRKNRPSDEPSPMCPVYCYDRRFDGTFGCEYMGSTEYEVGVPVAFRQMSTQPLCMRSVEITRGGVIRVVYFVAASHNFDQMIEAFEQWFSRPRLEARELTYFDMLFEQNFPDYMKEEFRPRTAAWWSLGDNVAWTLDETIAGELLAAFSMQPATT